MWKRVNLLSRRVKTSLEETKNDQSDFNVDPDIQLMQNTDHYIRYVQPNLKRQNLYLPLFFSGE